MPRLGRFWTAHQDIVVDHVISDRTQESMISPVDLRVRYGSGQFQDEVATRLFDDQIMAVASTAFLKGREIKTMADISVLPLLSVEGVDWSWTLMVGTFCAMPGVPTRRLNISALQQLCDCCAGGAGWSRYCLGVEKPDEAPNRCATAQTRWRP